MDGFRGFLLLRNIKSNFKCYKIQYNVNFDQRPICTESRLPRDYNKQISAKEKQVSVATSILLLRISTQVIAR